MTPRLDRRIVLQTRTTTRDEIGGLKETWADTITLWAGLSENKSKEAQSAESIREISDKVFTIRHRAIDTTNNRITYKGKTYNITGTGEANGRKSYLKVFCYSA